MNESSVKSRAHFSYANRYDIAKTITEFLEKFRKGLGTRAVSFNVSSIVASVDYIPGNVRIRGITNSGTLNCLVHAGSIIVEGFLIVAGGKSEAQKIVQMVEQYRKDKSAKQLIRARIDVQKTTKKGPPQLKQPSQPRDNSAAIESEQKTISRAQETLNRLIGERRSLESMRQKQVDIIPRPGTAKRIEELRKGVAIFTEEISRVSGNIAAQERIIRDASTRIARLKRM